MAEPEFVPDPSRPRACTLRIGGADQSYVDLDDPLRLEFDYIQRLADLLDLLAPPGERLRVVHVGGAAMTLPRYVAATRPHSAQVVLEPDAALTALVRERLPLPPRSGIKVRAIDGVAGIAAMPDNYADAAIVDAFAGAQVPPDLTTRDFLADLGRVVGGGIAGCAAGGVGGGVVALNLTDRGPFGYARRVVAGFAATFAQVAMLAEPSTIKGRRFGNVIVLGSRRPLPLDDLARRAGLGAYPFRLVHGARLVQLTSGAKPFQGADRSPSPVPPELWRLSE